MMKACLRCGVLPLKLERLTRNSSLGFPSPRAVAVTLRHLTVCMVSWLVMFVIITQSLTESREVIQTLACVLMSLLHMLELDSYSGLL